MSVIFDIDGTIADCSHRLHFIDGLIQKDWDSFFEDERMMRDVPVAPMLDLLTVLWEDQDVYFLTGRPEHTRLTTAKWIGVNAGIHVPPKELLMRPEGDRRRSSLIKNDHLAALREDGIFPTIAFEDRADDAQMYRANGLICCQVAEGAY